MDDIKADAWVLGHVSGVGEGLAIIWLREEEDNDGIGHITRLVQAWFNFGSRLGPNLAQNCYGF